MEQVRDAQVMRLIERIGEHYRANISNRFIRPALLQLSLDKTTWTHVETMTEKFDPFHYQSMQLGELYRHIASLARFVAIVRREIAPTLKQRLNSGTTVIADKVLLDMAVNAFSANLELLANMVYDLYNRLKKIDTGDSSDRRPLYERVPEFSDIEDILINR